MIKMSSKTKMSTDQTAPTSTTRVDYKVWREWDDVIQDCQNNVVKPFVRKWECDDTVTFVVTAEVKETPYFEVCCNFLPYSIASNIVEAFPWLKLKKHRHLFFVEGIIKDLNALLTLYQHTAVSSESNIIKKGSQDNIICD